MTFFCARWVALSLLVALLSACSPRMLLVRNVADELASQGQGEEEDILLARDASAFYLKLSESVLRQTPDHLPLAEAVAGGFTQYAYAFVAFEADRTEAQDAKAAQRLRERAARLYLRAHRHAMTALELHNPDIGKALTGNPADRDGPVMRLPSDQVGVAYWAAASWGGYIALSKDKPDVVADLPLATRLATLAWLSEPRHGSGALASLMGSFEAARPGGSLLRAAAYFDQGIEAGQGSNAGAFVAKAESLAMSSGDRAAFESLLRQAIAISATHRNLGNEVMRERAQWLLDTADDHF
ncbi:MAG: TRAP transporter TatT component family protein [Pseudomonadota bacterium]|nr:TRAP transporter TatT component family protein [Pseudomonadota bacterium]